MTVYLSAAALILSAWALVTSIQEDGELRQLEQRLACLELDGANDCGVDGR